MNLAEMKIMMMMMMMKIMMKMIVINITQSSDPSMIRDTESSFNLDWGCNDSSSYSINLIIKIP